MPESVESLQARRAALAAAIAARPDLGVVKGYTLADGSRMDYRSLEEMQRELAQLDGQISASVAESAGVVCRRTLVVAARRAC